MKKIKTRELWKKKKKNKNKNNQNFFTPESVPATFSSRLCHHLRIIVKLLFLQTWVGGSEYEGGGVTFSLQMWGWRIRRNLNGNLTWVGFRFVIIFYF
jgi:hypothetical protein